MSFYPRVAPRVLAAAPPGPVWDVFGVVFTNAVSPVLDNSDVQFDSNNTTLWSDNQTFQNQAGDESRCGWESVTPLNGGFLNVPHRYYGYINHNIGTDPRFRIGIPAAAIGQDYDVVASTSTLHSLQFCTSQVYRDGTTLIDGFVDVTFQGTGRFHLDGVEYNSPALWEAEDAPGNLARIRVTNVQEFIELRVSSSTGSYPRFNSFRLYRVTS